MENLKISKKALLALGAVSVGAAGVQAADTDLGNSVEVRTQMIDAQSTSVLQPFDAEAKCGEAKCGEKKTKSKESKCGESKCGEAKCGEKKEKKKSKSKESKCGESKCGESKCGEG